MEIKNFQKTPEHEVSFTLCLAGEEWRPYLETASAELQKAGAVRGFRAGKAPLGAALRHYGSRLTERAAQLALPAALERACAEKQLDPVTEPVFSQVCSGAEGLTAGCGFTAYPQVEDLAYRGLRVEKPVRICTEEEVDAGIERFRQQHLNVHAVDREARMDDIVEVRFSGTHEGGPFPYDHSEKSRFRLGSGQLFAGLDEALAGHRAGETLKLTLTMPQDFHREEIRGFTLDLEVGLLGVWARDLEECTDDFVKRNTADCSTVAQLREKLRGQLQAQLDRQCARRYRQNLDHAIAALVTCPIPPSMIQVALDGMLNALRPAARQRGMTVEQLLASEGRTVQAYLDQCRPIAEEKVRRSIALDYVIRQEGMTVSEQEYKKELTALAGGQPLAAAERLRGGRDEIVSQMLNEKAKKWIDKHAAIVEVSDSEPTAAERQARR